MKLPTPAEADKIIAEEYDIGVVIPMTDRVRLTVELAATTMALRRNIETLDRKLSEAETRLEMLDGAANDAVVMPWPPSMILVVSAIVTVMGWCFFFMGIVQIWT